MARNYWMFVQTPANFAITKERGFDVYGLKTRQRRRAQRMEPDDRVLFYISGDRKWPATATITSRYFEDRTPIWESDGRSGDYPYRVKLSPAIVLAEKDYIDALELGPRLEYLKRWAPDKWPLAFVETLHLLPQRDFRLIEGEMKRFTSKRRNRGRRRREEEAGSTHRVDSPVAGAGEDDGPSAKDAGPERVDGERGTEVSPPDRRDTEGEENGAQSANQGGSAPSADEPGAEVRPPYGRDTEGEEAGSERVDGERETEVSSPDRRDTEGEENGAQSAKQGGSAPSADEPGAEVRPPHGRDTEGEEAGSKRVDGERETEVSSPDRRDTEGEENGAQSAKQGGSAPSADEPGAEVRPPHGRDTEGEEAGSKRVDGERETEVSSPDRRDTEAEENGAQSAPEVSAAGSE